MKIIFNNMFLGNICNHGRGILSSPALQHALIGIRGRVGRNRFLLDIGTTDRIGINNVCVGFISQLHSNAVLFDNLNQAESYYF